MKVTFVDSIDTNSIGKAFACYQYDEVLSQHPLYVDVRGIVQSNSQVWLDDLQRSFSQLSQAMLKKSKWWWCISPSRLDIRPWAQEHVIKPLFLAKALVIWGQGQGQNKEIIILGKDRYTARYLKEMNPNIQVDGLGILGGRALLFTLLLRNATIVMARLVVQAILFLKHHVFAKPLITKKNVLVLFDLVRGESPSIGHKYYFGSIFDEADINSLVAFACIAVGKKQSIDKMSDKSWANNVFYLFDNLNLKDLIFCVYLNIKLFLLTVVVSLSRIPCNIQDSLSTSFWSHYLLREMGRLSQLSNLCCYRALKSVLEQGKYSLVIYPYEEKASERSFLYACQEKGIKTAGYTPHPQHRLALALRDFDEPVSPKPSIYAVCGNAYVDYFKDWGRKDVNVVHMWGTSKFLNCQVRDFVIDPGHLRILLLVSHPNELNVMYSWLKAETRLSKNVTYIIRLYKALKSKELAINLQCLKEDFHCIVEGEGSLLDDLAKCDFAAFCATSAGIVAIQNGYLAIHLCLDDLFLMNPCFDKLENMLSCPTAKHFADRLGILRTTSSSQIRDMIQQQQSSANDIFSPLDWESIKEDVLNK